MRPECRAGDRRDGFTLLEVIVSLVILGLVLGSVYRIAGTSIAAVSTRSDGLRLALIAEAVLTAADLYRDIDDIEEVVPVPSDIDIDVEWTPLPADAFGEDTGLPEDLDQRLELVEVRVEASDGRSLELRSVVQRPAVGEIE